MQGLSLIHIQMCIRDRTKVSQNIKEIIFTATIYKADERRQNFGQVRNSYIRIYDAKTNKMCIRDSHSPDGAAPHRTVG